MTFKRITYGGDWVQFKALDDRPGGFEAAFSVIGNVDLVGDTCEPGFMDKTLATWREAGDPVPVIWSHEWGDPFSHVGWADPSEIQEVSVGKKAAGGGPTGAMVARGQFDIDKEFAAQVYDLVKSRRVKEWSFAYDVVKEHMLPDKSNGLQEVDLIEFGPTLKGANPATFTITVKSALERAAKKDRLTELLAMGDRITDAGTYAVYMKSLIAAAAEDEHLVSRKDLEEYVHELELDGKEKDMTETKWDGAAAMASCSSAADYRKIAFERANDSDPDTAAHWALPHHPNPGAGADPDGVSAAIGALNGARGGKPDLKNEGAARSHLEAHQSAEGAAKDEDEEKSGYSDGESAGEMPVQIMDEAKSDDDAKVGTVTIGVELDEGDLQSIKDRLAELETQVKAGRVIGAKAASALKSRLGEAVDTFVAEVNGTSQDAEKDDTEHETKTDDEEPRVFNADILAKLTELEGEK